MTSESGTGNDRDSPKTIVATPKPATDQSMAGPARSSGGRCARTNVMMIAPTAGAVSNQPKPVGPTLRICFANTAA